MKWISKHKPFPREGDVRFRKRFAFLPVETTGGKTVWLEFYLSKQVRRYRIAGDFYGGFGSYYWIEEGAYPLSEEN